MESSLVQNISFSSSSFTSDGTIRGMKTCWVCFTLTNTSRLSVRITCVTKERKWGEIVTANPIRFTVLKLNQSQLLISSGSGFHIQTRPISSPSSFLSKNNSRNLFLLSEGNSLTNENISKRLTTIQDLPTHPDTTGTDLQGGKYWIGGLSAIIRAQESSKLCVVQVTEGVVTWLDKSQAKNLCQGFGASTIPRPRWSPPGRPSYPNPSGDNEQEKKDWHTNSCCCEDIHPSGIGKKLTIMKGSITEIRALVYEIWANIVYSFVLK